MRCVYLDYESFYDKDYTLHKMSIEEYVRDPRFEAHLLGVAIDDGPVQMVPAHLIPQALKVLRLDDPDCFMFAQNCRFDGFITTERYGVRIANPLCTRSMSRWTGLSRLTRESLEAQCEFLGTGVKGTFIHAMQGRHISELGQEELQEYTHYCMQDVEQLRANVKKMLPFMTPDSLRFIMMTLRMYLNPAFVLNAPMLEDYYAKLSAAYAESQAKLQHMFRFDTQEAFLKALRSKAQFCKMLESIGGTVPYKLSEKKTDTKRKQLEARLAELNAVIEGYNHGTVEYEKAIEERKTVQGMLDAQEYIVMEPALAKKDIEFMELMASDNPDIAALATARAENNSSLAMSRCETFMRIAQRGLLPVPLEAYQAHTGRYAAGTSEGVKSDGVNLQNLAKRTGDKTLRKCIQAPHGYRVVACDSSQIEARVLAWLAGQTDLLHDFKTGADPYCRMASVAYSEPYETIHYYTKGAGAHDPNADPELLKKYKSYRNVGKTMVLQLGYYSGGDKLALYLLQQGIQLKVTKEEHGKECKRLVSVYRTHNAAIRQFWNTCDEVILALLSGHSGYFGGPKGTTFFYDGSHKVFGRTVPGVMLPDGYWLLYPELRVEAHEKTGKPVYKYSIIDKGKRITKQLHSGVLCNNITQGLAFGIMRFQALHIDIYYPIRINIHDSWGILVHETQVEIALDYMMKCMRYLPPWAEGLPIDCEGETGIDFTIV